MLGLAGLTCLPMVLEGFVVWRWKISLPICWGGLDVVAHQSASCGETIGNATFGLPQRSSVMGVAAPDDSRCLPITMNYFRMPWDCLLQARHSQGIRKASSSVVLGLCCLVTGKRSQIFPRRQRPALA